MMLGAYSSRIVRSVGCAALTLLLAATTCPTFGAPAARAMKSLSAAELASLPDGTLVKLKAGRTVSLGVLRAEHKLRLQRFADAAMLGKQHGALGPATHGVYAVPEMRGSLTRLGTPVPQGTLVPMDFSLKNFSVAYAQNYTLPADFLAFCKTALATGCLYTPSGVPLYFWQLPNDPNEVNPNGNGMFVDFDPLEQDQQLCKSQGGKFAGEDGCGYYYPLRYKLYFNPMSNSGVYTYPLANVTQSANCPLPPFDNKGNSDIVIVAYDKDFISNISNGLTVTFPKLQSCVVSVFAKK